MVAKRDDFRGRVDWEVGVSRYKLLYIEWINNKVLYSTENYIQYSMISQNEEDYLKKNVCMCIH